MREDPAIAADPLLAAKANEYLTAVQAAVAVHDPEFAVDSTGRGAYRWPKEMPVPFDGAQQPLNQSNALGSALAELTRITGDPAYRSKVTALARGQRQSMTPNSGAAYQWPYWPAWGSGYAGWAATGYTSRDLSSFTQGWPATKGAEDISHAAINIEFIAACHHAGLAFTWEDLRRLSRTYVDNVIAASNPPAIHFNVDKTGGAGNGQAALQAIRWMPVASWSKTVYDHGLALARYVQMQPTQGSHVLCYANLNWGANRPWPS